MESGLIIDMAEISRKIFYTFNHLGKWAEETSNSFPNGLSFIVVVDATASMHGSPRYSGKTKAWTGSLFNSELSIVLEYKQWRFVGSCWSATSRLIGARPGLL